MAHIFGFLLLSVRCWDAGWLARLQFFMGVILMAKNHVLIAHKFATLLLRETAAQKHRHPSSDANRVSKFG